MASEQSLLKLVQAEKDDPQLSALLSTEDTLAYLSETRSYAVPMVESLIFKVLYEGRLIGEAALKTIRWFNRKAELSVYIIAPYRKRQIGTRVLKDLINIGFCELSLYRLEAEIYEYNAASIKLAENLGFVYEGRLRKAKFYAGQYYDILRYGLLKDEYTEPCP
jgi:RimJ/RimL family protein N-acetyltransferase